MRKQFIYFAGVLFLMTAAVLAVTAQENTSTLNNTALNNTTLNNTTLNVSLNQTQNATAIEPINATVNETMIAVPQANLNETANETLNQTVLNETVPIEMEIVPVQNETVVPAMNVTNETVPVEMEIVPVQNETVVLAMNETNETLPAQNVTTPAQNESASAQNVTLPENTTLKAEPVNSASITATVSQPQVTQLGSPANPVFVIGTGLKSGEATQIGDSVQSQNPSYQVGSPATSVWDLSSVALETNVI